MARFRRWHGGGTRGEGAVRTLVTEDGSRWHSTGADVARPLRQLLSRWQVQCKGGVPTRLSATSTLSGEGTTFVARSLGDLIASDLQRSVCVVDLNWWTPPLPGLADAERAPADPPQGLAGVLRGDLPLGAALSATSNPLLWSLPAGPAGSGERSAMAHGPDLRAQLDELEERFDHVILDVPAIRLCGESVALASLAEGTVLVVRHGTTTIDQVRAALDELSYSPVLGVVLNRATSRVPRWLTTRIGLV